MKELDIKTLQDVTGQIETLFLDLGLNQSIEHKTAMLHGEVEEMLEAQQNHIPGNEQTKKELAGEAADVIFCVLSLMNDYGIDANEAMNSVFTKVLNRVNGEHVAIVKSETGLNGKELYCEAKRIADSQ